mmetsp:Transcript_46569/g.63409  ORF Transcript_46569/g.63409 Transcript_46569/m.63409 type:complete len:273 (-) Transcript_46569:193-1011(-)
MLGSRILQSASLPGSTVDVRRDFRRTKSLAAFAAFAASWAAAAFRTMASRSFGCHSNNSSRAAPTTVSTADLTPGLPSLFFVCPSNSGSGTLTETTAVSPSRMYSPAMFEADSFSFPVRRAAALIVRVMTARKPSTWVPPSLVRMLFAKETTDSVYTSEDHRNATSTSMSPWKARAYTVLGTSLGRWAVRGDLPMQSSSMYSAMPPAWTNSRDSNPLWDWSVRASRRTIVKLALRYASSSRRVAKRSNSNDVESLNIVESGLNDTIVPDTRG